MMKRLFLTAALALPLAASQVSAQTQAPRPAQPARGGGAPPAMNGFSTGTISIHELPSNQESKVDTDRFIGYPGNAFSKVWNGLMTRSMLRAGDPYHPGASGAVLEYRDDLGVATLEGHAESGTADRPAVSFYYVQGGAGRVDTGPGTKAYDLHPGVGVLIAPGVKQHFVNTGDARLSMIAMTWTNNEGLKVKLPIKVQDTNTETAGSNGVHWIMSGKHLFDVEDGINLTAGMIYIPAGTYSGPHGHGKGVEEIWVKTGSDVGYAILGSEIRKIDGAGAFLAPPNGLTVHSSMNTNTDHPAVWLYLSRRTPSHTGP
jgi:quercetin dioxygenase-like cupin family protein